MSPSRASTRARIRAARRPLLFAQSSAAATSAIAGTVTGPGGLPLRGIAVAAIPSDASGSIATTTTGADGTYTVPVAPGTYRVAFNDATAAHASGFAAPGGWTGLAADASEVSVGDTAAQVDVELPEGSAILGTVTGQDGQPVADTRLVAEDAAGTAVAESVTDALGRYVVSVPRGSWLVHVPDSGATVPGYYAAGGYAATRAAADPVTADADPAEGVDITLPLAAGVTGSVTRRGRLGRARHLGHRDGRRGRLAGRRRPDRRPGRLRDAAPSRLLRRRLQRPLGIACPRVPRGDPASSRRSRTRRRRRSRSTTCPSRPSC